MIALTEQQRLRTCDLWMSDPVPLAKADLQREFVYDRGYGLFYVPGGFHQAAMSQILAFQHGELFGIDVAEKLGVEYSRGTADYWLEKTPGAVFLSSMAARPYCWNLSQLNSMERRRFGELIEVSYRGK